MSNPPPLHPLSSNSSRGELMARKLIAIEYMSLDGVIQAPGHAGEDSDGGFEAGGWTGPLMPDHQRYNTESFQTAGATILLGRKDVSDLGGILAERDRPE